MTRRDEAHVRPNHHIVPNVEAAKIIESAVLIDEDIPPHTDLFPTRSKKGGISRKLSSAFLPISSLNKARTSSASSNVKRFSLAVIAVARLTLCHHRRRLRRPPVNDRGAIVVRHSFSSPTYSLVRVDHEKINQHV